MDRSQVKWLYLSVGFSIAVLIIILALTINENTLTYLQQINPLFLLLAFLTHILTMCFWAWRVQKMSGSLGYRIGFFYSLNLVFANLLAAAITPAQAGGERSVSMNYTKPTCRWATRPPSSSWNGCWTASPLQRLLHSP